MKTHNFTCDLAHARKYTTADRAAAAAQRMFPRAYWWRIVEVSIGQIVIDTHGGYLAK